MSAEVVELNVDPRGDGSPLVVLHGLYGAGSNWGRHAKWLARDWRVYAPDLRNHGRSPHAEPMDYPAMAADVEGLLDREGHQSAVVLGHSMGGKVAMTLALTRPERIRGLVVADIAPVNYGSDHGHGSIVKAMQAVDLEAVRSRADADEELAGTVDEAGIRQFLLTNLQRGDDGWHWRLPLSLLADAMPLIEGFPELGGTWNGPALFIHGERSDYIAEGRPRGAIDARFPNAEVESIPGAGHFLHVEAPERFADILQAWLGRHFPAG